MTDGEIHRAFAEGDRGARFDSLVVPDVLARARPIASRTSCSMSGTGCCYDNAPVESFFATLKKELIYRHRWEDRTSVVSAITDYIGIFYNHQRRHSALGYLSPSEYERHHQQEAALAA